MNVHLITIMMFQLCRYFKSLDFGSSLYYWFSKIISYSYICTSTNVTYMFNINNDSIHAQWVIGFHNIHFFDKYIVILYCYHIFTSLRYHYIMLCC